MWSATPLRGKGEGKGRGVHQKPSNQVCILEFSRSSGKLADGCMLDAGLNLAASCAEPESKVRSLVRVRASALGDSCPVMASR